MNKYIFCLAAAALSLGAFTACEDVPAPYGINNSGNNNGGNTGETKTIFAANFDTSADGFTFQNVTLGDGLTYVWKQDVYNGKGYLKASAYANSQSNPSEAWAVSPAINLSDCTEATLNFRQAINKIEPGVPAEMYSVWASTDYAGDVTTATWTQLNVPSFPEGNSWTFSDAGAIDLAAFCGKENVRIAYKYTSTSEASGTWEVDEFTITGNGTAMDNGGTDTPDTPGTAQGDGSQANPYNALGATAYVKTLAADVNSEQDVYIKGKVAQIDEAYGTQYGNGSFLISEDGTTTNTFKVWRALYLGNKKYTEGQTALKVGDEVIVCGKVVNFKGNTPETAQGQAYLYSLNGVTEGGETPSTPDQPSTPDEPATPSEGTTVKASDFGVANGEALTTITLSDGTKLTFNGGGNSNAPKYYDNGTNVRVYPQNTITVTGSKKIAKIILNCDTYNGTICNASGDVTATPGSVSVNGSVITISGINAQSTVITNTSGTTGAASQIRFTSITIVYAD